MPTSVTEPDARPGFGQALLGRPGSSQASRTPEGKQCNLHTFGATPRSGLGPCDSSAPVLPVLYGSTYLGLRGTSPCADARSLVS